MTRRGLLASLAGLAAAPAHAESVSLRRGINITGWFRFPASRDPAALRGWITDPALQDLRRLGFDFVRLAVDSGLLDDTSMLPVFIGAIRRLHTAGLTAVVSLHPNGWHLESNPADKARLLRFWSSLAPALRPLDPLRTVPEVLNEPVFPGDAAGWGHLQREVLAVIRQALPAHTVMLTGHDWGSVGGLLALTPEADQNVVYSVHFYDPVELTSLAAYRQGLDRAALARLPFPDTEDAGCRTMADQVADADTRGLMQFYCAMHWNAQRISAAIDRAADWAALHHTRLVLGEFGASMQLNRAARLAWLRTVREACERRGAGWALWGYDDIMGYGVSRPPPPRPDLDREITTALGLGRSA